MASLKVFTKRIRRRARQVETGASRILRVTALTVNQTVILATPVDTGHARANWQIGIDAPITEEIDEDDEGGLTTVARNASIIRSATPRKAIVLSNNVPYINLLNEGSSSQAPAQFVQLAILDAINAVKKIKVFE